MKKFVKLIIIIWSLVLITGVFFVFALFSNIYPYSIYYAQHIESSKRNSLTIMLLVDNLDYIITPKNKNISYDYDGNRSINCSISKNSENLGLSNGDGYTYFGKNYKIYHFNHKMKLLDVVYYNRDIDIYELPTNNINVTDVKLEILETMKPIIDAQKKPETNLQWLFSLVYRNKIKSLH